MLPRRRKGSDSRPSTPTTVSPRSDAQRAPFREPARNETSSALGTAPTEDRDGQNELRERWRQSPENLTSRTRFLGLMLVGLLLVYAGIAAVVFSSFDPYDERGDGLLIIGSAAALIGFGVSLWALIQRSAIRAAFYERQDEAAKQGVDDAIQQLESDVDLPGLLLLNRRQMEAYESLTRRQAASSYRLSHVALAVGLLLVVAGSVAALLADADAAKAASAGLAAVAAAVSGYIARTYLRIYERTLSQLNYYFEQPLITSYVLTAERLVERMSETHRDDALARMVDQLCEAIHPRLDAIPGRTQD